MPSNQKVIFIPRYFDKSRLHEEVVSRIGENYANTSVENSNSMVSVEDNPHMETKEIREEFIAEFNTEQVSVTNSKPVVDIAFCTPYDSGPVHQ